MKFVLKLEEVAQFIGGIFLFSRLDFPWWWFPALLLLPDIGMLGYLFNNKIGSLSYNLLHHKGIAVLWLLIGYYTNQELVILIGIIWYSHSALDRVFGYGLKFNLSFKDTHLGNIGNEHHRQDG